MNILNDTIWGNPLKLWIYAFASIIGIFFILRYLKSIVCKRLSDFASKTTSKIDDLFTELVKSTSVLALLILSIYITSLLIKLPTKANTAFRYAFLASVLIQVGMWGHAMITFSIHNYMAKRIERNHVNQTTIEFLGFAIKALFYSILLLVGLNNLGVNISALVAGLGVGGVAIALAVQSILGDLFASLTIVLDKPFIVGDFIVVDSFMGTIEQIGLKTTRLRSSSGEQLIFSNADLLKGRIRNYQRMSERRVEFSIQVAYNTPLHKLRLIPGLLRSIVESKKKVRFDRAHFEKYGAQSLDFVVVYWVTDPDCNLYMDIQQAVNLEIFQVFTGEQIDFPQTPHHLPNSEAASSTA